MTLTIIGFIFSIFTGGAAGAVINNYRIGLREKKRRRTELRGFLKRWKSQICVTDMPADECFDRLYKVQIQEFHALSAGMAGDFGNRAVEFTGLTSSFGGLMQGESGHHQMPKETLLKAIDALIRFINAAQPDARANAQDAFILPRRFWLFHIFRERVAQLFSLGGFTSHRL